jgi:hypothetical protein
MTITTTMITTSDIINYMMSRMSNVNDAGYSERSVCSRAVGH